MSATAAAAPEGTRPRKRLVTQLWFWVLVAIAAGIVFGLVAPDTAKKAKWLADAFIQLIKTVTGPVIFVTVVVGIASLGNLARAGGLALRALAYFFCATVVALTLGLLAANIVQPGAGFEGSVSDAGREAAKESISEAGTDSGIVPFITGHLLPTSFLQPFVDNEILQVLVIAILTAVAISMLPRVQREQIVGDLRDLRRRRARDRRPAERLQHLQDGAAHQGRAAHHRRHVVVGDRAAAPARQARGGRGVAPDGRRRDPDRLLVQPRRHVHLPHARGAVHHPGVGPGHVGRPADRARGAHGPDEQGRRRHHRRRARDPHRLAAGVRRRVLLRAEHRRRHRARGRDRPHHERGPRADERHRQQRRDDGDRRLAGRTRRRALQSRAQRAIDHRPRGRGGDAGEDDTGDGRAAPRFERDGATGAHVAAGSEAER